MQKLDWHEPKFISQRNFSLASDTSAVNLYILRKKYNIEVAERDEILFRRYNGSNLNRNGYGFCATFGQKIPRKEESLQ